MIFLEFLKLLGISNDFTLKRNWWRIVRKEEGKQRRRGKKAEGTLRLMVKNGLMLEEILAVATSTKGREGQAGLGWGRSAGGLGGCRLLWCFVGDLWCGE